MVRVPLLIGSVAIACCCGLIPRAAAAAAPTTRRATTKPIDVLDYFLQRDDRDDGWTINGHDVRADVDPEGTGADVIVCNKWSNPNSYEIYKATPTELQIRYEV